MEKLMIIVLAAGEGTRMKSEIPKVLHPLAGQPMVFHVLDIAESQGKTGPRIAVLGRAHKEVKKLITKRGWHSVIQKERLGTGHAVLCANSYLEKHRGCVLVLNGDTPLLKAATLSGLLKRHRKSGASMTMLTAKLADPSGYGRIIRDSRGRIEGIVEQKELGRVRRPSDEINAGVYVFQAGFLKEHLPALERHESSGEYYLTDLAEKAFKAGTPADSHLLDEPEEAFGVNSRRQLAEAEAVIRRRILDRLMDSGVTIVDPANTYIESDVVVGRDTVLLPCVTIEGRTRIGRGCRIGPHVRVTDGSIGDGVILKDGSVIEGVSITKGSIIPPMTYMR